MREFSKILKSKFLIVVKFLTNHNAQIGDLNKRFKLRYFRENSSAGVRNSVGYPDGI